MPLPGRDWIGSDIRGEGVNCRVNQVPGCGSIGAKGTFAQESVEAIQQGFEFTTTGAQNLAFHEAV